MLYLRNIQTGAISAVEEESKEELDLTKQRISGTRPLYEQISEAQVIAQNGDLTPSPTSGGSGVPNGGTTGQVLAKTSNADGAATWTDVAGGSTPDATTGAKGKLQLAGDLGGSAASPRLNLLGAMTLLRPGGGTNDDVAINAALLAGDVALSGDFMTTATVAVPANRQLLLLDASISRQVGGTVSQANILMNAAAANWTSGAIATPDAGIRLRGVGRAVLKHTVTSTITRSGAANYNLQGVSFVRCDGLFVDGITIGSCIGWGLATQGVTNSNLQNVHLAQDGAYPNQDGLDVGPGCINTRYSNFSGSSPTDDFISIFGHNSASIMHPAVNTTNLTGTAADIRDLTFRGFDVRDHGVDCIRINAGDARSVSRLRFRNFTTQVSSGAVFVQFGQSSYVSTNPSLSQFCKIDFSDCNIGGCGLVNLDQTCSDITFQAITQTFAAAVIKKSVPATATANANLTIDGFVCQESLSTAPDFCNIASGTLAGLTLRDITHPRLQRLLNNAGTVTEVDISDIKIGILGSSTAGALIASAVAETGSIDNVRYGTLAGAATGRYVGAAMKMRMGPNMPIFDTGDTTPLATTKGSRALATAAKQLDGGAGTTGAEWIANGTTWIKAVDLGASF